MKASNTNIYLRIVLTVLLAGSLLCMGNIRASIAQSTPATTNTSTTDPIADLNQQIADKKQALADLQQQQAALQQAVDSATGQVHDIQSQISLINAQIAQSNFAISTKQQEISELDLEMLSIQQQVDTKTADMNTRKDQLASAIRQIDSNSRVSTLALVLAQDNFSDFYSQAQATTQLSDNLRDNLQQISAIRDELKAKKDELIKARDDVRQAQLQLEIQRSSVVDQKSYKDQLLSQAQTSQSDYQTQLSQAVQSEQQADSLISTLEKQVENQLNGGVNGDVPVYSSKGFIWPVKGPVTAYFRDPSYPYNFLYCAKGQKPPACGHPAIDIGVPQGTPVRAAADGTILVVNAPSWYYNSAGQKTGSAINYVSIDHGNGISTRYLHLSAIYVKPLQFVKQGEIIGLSGGLPGTGGAGPYTTGAHLHFELRLNGIVQDPLQYLP